MENYPIDDLAFEAPYGFNFLENNIDYNMLDL